MVTRYLLHRILHSAVNHDAVAKPAAVAACGGQDACKTVAAEAAELVIKAPSLHCCTRPLGLATSVACLPAAQFHADLIGTAADVGGVDHEA